MKNLLTRTIALIFGAVMCVACTESVDFSVKTLPEIEGVKAEMTAERSGDEWRVEVRVRNESDAPQTFKVQLSAEPRFRAETYLIPGTNYNGNRFGDNVNLPQGWERDGEPWIFAYDRSSIPSCTISENEDKVFALFVSDRDTTSYVSA